MRVPSSVKMVILDMDGVLLLSGCFHEKAYKKVLGDIGVSNFDYSRFAGMRTDECLRMFLEENRYNFTDETISRLTEQKRILARELLEADVPILPDCRSVLKSLHSKYRLILASSASKKNIELFLKHSESSEFFDFVIHGSMVERAKPSPDIYLLCISKAGVLPQECLVIEDSSAGVKAARAAGILVYAVLGTEEKGKLEQNGAQVVINNLKDIISLI